MNMFAKKFRLTTQPALVVGLLLQCCFVIGSVSQNRQIDPEIERKINDYICNVYLPESNVTDLGLAIVQNDGEVLYTNGYGLADQERQIPNTNDTQFVIGSVTKSMTSVALLKALTERFPELGEAVLDTPIRNLLPEFNFTLIDRFRSEHGNFRDLLSHRMCLPANDFALLAEAVNTTDEVAYRQRYSEEICGLRTQMEYNNQMYVVAGELLSHLTGKPYDDAIEDFMKKLGMTDSKIIRLSDDYSNLPERARPYYIDTVDGEIIPRPINTDLVKRIALINAAGGVSSSPNEMARYLRFHLNLGEIDGKQVLPEDVMQWTRKPGIHVPTKFSDNDALLSLAYGLGLGIYSYDGMDYFAHGGYLTPYASQMTLVPEKKIGVFTSCNQGPLLKERLVLHTFIIETLKGSEGAAERAAEVRSDLKLTNEDIKLKQDKAIGKFMRESKKLYGNRTPKAEELVGKYGNGAAGDAEIMEKWNDETNEMGLYISYGKWATGWLEHAEGPLYKILFDSDIVQDNYAAGIKEYTVFIRVEQNAFEFVEIRGAEQQNYGKFEIGVSLDKLPPIPWLPGSC